MDYRFVGRLLMLCGAALALVGAGVLARWLIGDGSRWLVALGCLQIGVGGFQIACGDVMRRRMDPPM